mgnify:CR=1 FL=1
MITAARQKVVELVGEIFRASDLPVGLLDACAARRNVRAAGVGVMVHFSRVAGEWLPILVAVIVSTALAIGVSALVMQALMRGRGGADDGEGGA